MNIVKDICYIQNIYVYIDWSDIQLQLRFAPSPGRFQVCFLLRYVNNVTVTFEIINWHFLAFVFLGDGIFSSWDKNQRQVFFNHFKEPSLITVYFIWLPTPSTQVLPGLYMDVVQHMLKTKKMYWKKWMEKLANTLGMTCEYTCISI